MPRGGDWVTVLTVEAVRGLKATFVFQRDPHLRCDPSLLAYLVDFEARLKQLAAENGGITPDVLERGVNSGDIPLLVQRDPLNGAPSFQNTAFQSTTFQNSTFQNAAFFDAYFSNYIEGTEFPVEQAIRIVFEGKYRPADAHDVLGTYHLVGSREEMRRLPRDFDDLLGLMRRRHAVVMDGRPDKLPGRFKEVNNQAGATTFVEPALVISTLRQGYGMYQALSEPFARALFMMFLVAEVHPFADGNGRVARVMMNAELIAAGETRIFIPSIYRNEYVGGLKRLSNYEDPAAYLRVMGHAQIFVSRIDFTDLEATRRTLAVLHAFADPADDVKLRMPPGPSAI